MMTKKRWVPFNSTLSLDTYRKKHQRRNLVYRIDTKSWGYFTTTPVKKRTVSNEIGAQLNPYAFVGLGGMIHYINVAGVQARIHPARAEVEVGGNNLVIVKNDRGIKLGSFYYSRRRKR